MNHLVNTLITMFVITLYLIYIKKNGNFVIFNDEINNNIINYLIFFLIILFVKVIFIALSFNINKKKTNYEKILLNSIKESLFILFGYSLSKDLIKNNVININTKNYKSLIYQLLIIVSPELASFIINALLKKY